MKETYNNYFIEILKKLNIKIDNEKIEEIFKEIILEGKIKKLSEYVSELLSLSDNRIFMNLDEKYIELIYYTLLRHPLINTYIEYPNKNGYIDIYLMKKQELMKRNIMIEIKYIKKKEYSEKLLESKIKEGKEQLRRYSEDERLDNPIKYLVVYVGNKLKVMEEME